MSRLGMNATIRVIKRVDSARETTCEYGVYGVDGVVKGIFHCVKKLTLYHESRAIIM